MPQLTLEECIKLNRVEFWTLTPSQQKFLVESTNELVEEHDLKWFQENQGRLKNELEIVFKEI